MKKLLILFTVLLVSCAKPQTTIEPTIEPFLIDKVDMMNFEDYIDKNKVFDTFIDNNITSIVNTHGVNYADRIYTIFINENQFSIFIKESNDYTLDSNLFNISFNISKDNIESTYEYYYYNDFSYHYPTEINPNDSAVAYLKRYTSKNESKTEFYNLGEFVDVVHISSKDSDFKLYGSDDKEMKSKYDLSSIAYNVYMTTDSKDNDFKRKVMDLEDYITNYYKSKLNIQN